MKGYIIVFIIILVRVSAFIILIRRLILMIRSIPIFIPLIIFLIIQSYLTTILRSKATLIYVLFIN